MLSHEAPARKIKYNSTGKFLLLSRHRQTEKPILVFKISRKTLKADHNDFLFPTRTSWNFKLAVLDIITSVGGKK